jgi:branched-subunit amino acid ABC-type transport system permease component
MLQALVNGISEGALLALVALGLTLIYGISRFANVAHGDFLTLGAYSAWTCCYFLHLPIWLAVPVGIATTIGVGLLSHRLIFRPLAGQHALSLITSLGLALALRHVIAFFATAEQRSFDLPLWRAWRIGDVVILPVDVYLTIVSVVCVAGVHLLLKRSRLGIAMRAAAENPSLATVGGISVVRVQAVMWSVALALAAVAGMLLAAKTTVQPLMGWESLLPAFSAAVLGGLGNPYGAIAAAMVIGISQNFAVLWTSEAYKETFSFGVLFIALLIRPDGILIRRMQSR